MEVIKPNNYFNWFVFIVVTTLFAVIVFSQISLYATDFDELSFEYQYYDTVAERQTVKY